MCFCVCVQYVCDCLTKFWGQFVPKSGLNLTEQNKVIFYLETAESFLLGLGCGYCIYN